VTSPNNREAVFSAVVRAEFLKGKKRDVFYVVSATHSDRCFLLAAKWIRELELGIQRSTTENPRMRIQFSCQQEIATGI
jgi:hypothetical protein